MIARIKRLIFEKLFIWNALILVGFVKEFIEIYVNKCFLEIHMIEVILKKKIKKKLLRAKRAENFRKIYTFLIKISKC